MGDDGDGGEGDDRNGVDGVNGSSDGTQETFVKASAPPLLAGLHLAYAADRGRLETVRTMMIKTGILWVTHLVNDDKQREELRLLSVGSQF